MPHMPKNLTAIRSKVCSEILAKHLPLAREFKKHNAHKLDRCQHRCSSYHLELETSLGPKYEKLISSTIRKAWKGSTSTKYSNGVQHFMLFCDKERIPHNLRLPASELLLSAFASSLSGKLAGGTARGKISAIRAWHIQNNMPWLGGRQLTYVLRGVKSSAPTKSHRPARPPITASKLLALSMGLDHANSLDAAVYFAALAAFWGQIRLGELFSTTEKKFDCMLAPSINSLGIPNQNGSRTIHLPNTKKGGRSGEDIILCRQNNKLDPINALDAHLLINPGSPNDPLCGYFNSTGSRVALTRRRFLRRCNEVWTSNGFNASTGHEFRIGGTTHLLLAGIPPDVVKALGRWSSDSFLRYWRSLASLGTLYAEFLKMPKL